MDYPGGPGRIPNALLYEGNKRFRVRDEGITKLTLK